MLGQHLNAVTPARWWIALSVFLVSLGSYYFYNIGLYVFQILGLLLVLPFFRINDLRCGGLKFHLLTVFFFYSFGSGALFALFSGSNGFAISKLVLPLFFILWSAFCAVVFGNQKRNFHWALHKIIWIHVIVFIVQFVWFLISGDLIDFIEPITGEEQRALGGAYELAFLPGVLRATGLYNEPGTYSTWMMILFLLFRKIGKDLDLPNRYQFLEIFVIATVFLSFSTFGFVFASMYVVGMLCERKRNLISVLLVIGVLLPFVYFAYDIVDQKLALGANDSGLGFRTQVLDLYFSNLSPLRLAFGLGMFSDFFMHADAELVFQDVGLWFVMVFSVGVVGIVPLVLFLVLGMPRNITSLSLVLILLLSKFALTYAIVWIVLFSFVEFGKGPRGKGLL